MQTLSHFTKLPQLTINGTSMLAVTISSTVGAWSYISQGTHTSYPFDPAHPPTVALICCFMSHVLSIGTANLPVAIAMAGCSLLATGPGARMSQKISDKNLRLIMGGVLLCMTPLIVMKNNADEAKEAEKGFNHLVRRLTTHRDYMGESGLMTIQEQKNRLVRLVSQVKLPGGLEESEDIPRPIISAMQFVYGKEVLPMG